MWKAVKVGLAMVSQQGPNSDTHSVSELSTYKIASNWVHSPEKALKRVTQSRNTIFLHKKGSFSENQSFLCGILWDEYACSTRRTRLSQKHIYIYTQRITVSVQNHAKHDVSIKNTFRQTNTAKFLKEK